jgi:CelD/BcsL family acetyltransferase involved in cellulose biosynthesis
VILAREATALERRDWDELVARFPNCRIVHKRPWIEWLEASGCGTPLYVVFERNGAIVGAVPGLLVRLGLLRLYGSPLPGWQTPAMGPVFDSAQGSTAELVGALVPFLERRHGVHHIELLSGSLDAAAMRTLGFRSESIPTYRAPLYPGDEPRTLRQLKESARRNIKRATKLGLVARFVDDESFVAEHYSQLREVFVRGGNTVSFTEARALEFFRHMRAAGKLLAVDVCLPDGVSIATGLFTIDGRELLLWSWAHRTAHRWFRPTELLTWTVIQRAMAAGCDTLDFMGLGDFKTKFGAELDVTKERWVRSRYRWLTRARDFAERGYRWQQSLRGRIARVRTFGWGRGEQPDQIETPA